MAATAALSVTSAMTAMALAPRPLEFGDRGLRLGLVAADDRDGGAGFRQAPRHAEANAAIAAGDDGHLAGEIEWFCCHCCCLSFVMPGLVPGIHDFLVFA